MFRHVLLLCVIVAAQGIEGADNVNANANANVDDNVGTTVDSLGQRVQELESLLVTLKQELTLVAHRNHVHGHDQSFSQDLSEEVSQDLSQDLSQDTSEAASVSQVSQSGLRGRAPVSLEGAHVALTGRAVAGHAMMGRRTRGVGYTAPTVENLADRTQELSAVLDDLWVLLTGTLVVLMQAGFALFEAGSVRSKNASTVLLKNIIDVCVGTVGWFVVGYGLAFGEGSALIGSTNFPLSGLGVLVREEDTSYFLPTPNFRNWFFQWTFCATGATIVSGGVAERINFLGYIAYSLWMTVAIYPAIVHWAWTEEGWLAQLGYSDFAGSGVVHLTGGVAALVGAACLGPRLGRFDPAQEGDFCPHSVPLVVLGTFVLWFGWYGFNPGSTLAFHTTQVSTTAGLVAMNTTLAPVGGGLVVFFFRYTRTKRYDIIGICGGILAGLVSVCAGCNRMHPHSALIIGCTAGVVSELGHMLLLKLKVDDPLDAFAVHACGGALGVIAAPLANFNGVDSTEVTAAFAAVAAIASWSAVCSYIFMKGLDRVGLLTLADEVQLCGTDVHEIVPKRVYNNGMPDGSNIPSSKLPSPPAAVLVSAAGTLAADTSPPVVRQAFN